jgi:succinate dehydrogenase / fumarate reductase membrane anchor subunit
MNYRSPIAQARGLGASKEGVAHWWRLRVTALALIPLAFWLVIAIARWPRASHAEFVAWVSAPWNSVFLLATIFVAFQHSGLGLQVIIEDYVHINWLKILAIAIVKLLFGFLALAAVLASLRVVFMH